MRIVMTLIVRDEADVLEANLRVHRALGVDAFAVLDNGSTDGTPEILERWREAGLADVTTDAEANTQQVFREWQTRLARTATDTLEADWLIHNDADEFWWPLEGNLRSVLGAIPGSFSGVLAPRFEFVPRPGDGPWWDRLTVRERRATVRPKLAHRAAADVRVGPGSHHVISPSMGLEPTAGRPSLRGLRIRPEQPPLIAPAPQFPIGIWHLPLRSFEQYRRRLEIGLRIAGSTGSPALADRISAALEDEVVRSRWAEVAVSDESVDEGVADGRLARETALGELIRSLDGSNPKAIATGSVEAPNRNPAELEELRAEVAREAIAGLVHNDAQALGEADGLRASLEETSERLLKMRDRAHGLKRKLVAVRREVRGRRRELRRARRRLSRIEASRWWRLRPRLRRRRKR